jgi:hypothetical protein
MYIPKLKLPNNHIHQRNYSTKETKIEIDKNSAHKPKKSIKQNKNSQFIHSNRQNLKHMHQKN